MATFSERLKELRNSKKITQEALAGILNLGGKQIISSYEKTDKSTEPNIDTLILISKYFNVSIDYLLGNSDYPNPAIDQYISEACKIDVSEAIYQIQNLESCILKTYSQYAETVNIAKEQPENINKKIFFSENSFFKKSIMLFELINEYIAFLLSFNAEIDKNDRSCSLYAKKKYDFINEIKSNIEQLPTRIETVISLNNMIYSISPNVTEESKKLRNLSGLTEDSHGMALDTRKIKDGE